jgi:hypothetical protein
MFLLCTEAAPLFAQLPAPPAATPEFTERPFGPIPAPTKEPKAKAKDIEPSKPLPLGWKITIGAAIVLGTAGVLYGASKAWHSSNLFDREYRFPTGGTAALRFGGKRCGGHMATIRFGEPMSQPKQREPARSEAKNL